MLIWRRRDLRTQPKVLLYLAIKSKCYWRGSKGEAWGVEVIHGVWQQELSEEGGEKEGPAGSHANERSVVSRLRMDLQIGKCGGVIAHLGDMGVKVWLEWAQETRRSDNRDNDYQKDLCRNFSVKFYRQMRECGIREHHFYEKYYGPCWWEGLTRKRNTVAAGEMGIIQEEMVSPC